MFLLGSVSPTTHGGRRPPGCVKDIRRFDHVLRGFSMNFWEFPGKYADSRPLWLRCCNRDGWILLASPPEIDKTMFMTMHGHDSYIRVFADRIRVQLPLGILPEEHTKRQEVIVTVGLFASPDYLAAATPETLIDYRQVHDHVLRWQEQGHVGLIETLLQDLLPVCFTDARVTAVQIKIEKPAALARAESAGVEIFITRADYQKS